MSWVSGLLAVTVRRKFILILEWMSEQNYVGM